MNGGRTLDEKIQAATVGGPFPEGSFLHILHALDQLVGESNAHVTPAELLDAIVDLAVDLYGFCGRSVLRSWDLGSSEDVGYAVSILRREEAIAARPGETHADTWAPLGLEARFARAEAELLDAASASFLHPVARPPRRPTSWKG